MTAAIPGRLAGKVVLVSGAARGQGRAHCVRAAAEGADVIGFDSCAPVDGTPYAGASQADLDETARQVKALGRRHVFRVADVRDRAGVQSAVDEGVRQLGGLDGVVANAGIVTPAPALGIDAQRWQDLIDINLTGVFTTIQACLPALLKRGRGSVVVTSSANGGLKAPAHLAHYASSKFGVVGMVRSLANELGPQGLRFNTVHPTAVDTDMIQNESTYRLFAPDAASPGRDDVAPIFASLHTLDTPWVQPEDVAAAVAWLLSDEASMVTGIALPVDAGLAAR